MFKVQVENSKSFCSQENIKTLKHMKIETFVKLQNETSESTLKFESFPLIPYM